MILAMAEKRVTMQVEVAADIQDGLREFSKKTGRIQKEVVAKVIRWFIAQPAKVKRVVLGDVDGMEIAYAEALEDLARNIRPEPHFDKVAAEGPGAGRLNRQPESARAARKA